MAESASIIKKWRFRDREPQIPPQGIMATVAALVALLYGMLPSQDITADAWDYAGGLRWGFDLFEGHHLLHQVPVWVVYQLWGHTGHTPPDALALSTALQSVYLYVLVWQLMRLYQACRLHNREMIVWILFILSCHSLMRFSRVNEVYILPLVFSVAGLRIFVQGWRRSIYGEAFGWSRVGLSGLFFALGVLVHQLQIWWYLAAGLVLLYSVLKKERSWQTLAVFSLPVLLIPGAYWIVAGMYYQMPWTADSACRLFLDSYLQNPAEGMDISWSNSLFLWAAAIVRTFIKWPVYPEAMGLSYTAIGITLVIVALGGYFFSGMHPYWRRRKVGRIALGRSPHYQRAFGQKTAWLITIFLLLFSLFSVGNVEFLVGLPILIPLWRLGMLHSRLVKAGLPVVTALLFVWNANATLLGDAFRPLRPTEEVYLQASRYQKLHPDERAPVCWVLHATELAALDVYLNRRPTLQICPVLLPSAWENNCLNQASTHSRILQLCPKMVFTDFLGIQEKDSRALRMLPRARLSHLARIMHYVSAIKPDSSLALTYWPIQRPGAIALPLPSALQTSTPPSR